jgi:hypothetical protein
LRADVFQSGAWASALFDRLRAVACDDLSPVDYIFQAPVKEVESFEVDERRVTRLRRTVLRLESDLDIDLYATAAGMREGERPRTL